MQRVLIAIVLIALVLWLAHLVSAWQFRRLAQALAGQIETGGSGEMRADLPDPVATFARRGLSGNAPLPGVIALTQAAELQQQPGQAWQALTTHQVIGVTQPGFVWQAWQSRGPLTLVRVIDAFTAGKGRLEVRLLGSIPVARAVGPLADHAEAMRYLAELPWAPDAIALNREIAWRVLDSGEIEARLVMTPEDAVVRFALDARGDFAQMRADRRFTGMENGAPVFKHWEGRFTEYGEIDGRRIPRHGEVGYLVNGAYQPYFRGRVTGLTRP